MRKRHVPAGGREVTRILNVFVHVGDADLVRLPQIESDLAPVAVVCVGRVGPVQHLCPELEQPGSLVVRREL